MDFKDFIIDKQLNKSISTQIVELVIKNIQLKNLKCGDKLPTEREFAEILNVSRGTINNTYKKLEKLGIIETIQGSGSYILVNDNYTDDENKKKAINLMEDCISKISDLGFSNHLIFDMFENCLINSRKTVISIAIISNTQEFLIDFKKQLSILKNIKISVFIYENIMADTAPSDVLYNYDIIVVPSTYFNNIKQVLPDLRDKLIEVAVSTSFFTLKELSTLDKNSRIGVICRTNLFLSTVKETLISYGFNEDNIQSSFEVDYTIDTYFPGGINVLVSFSDAHVFCDKNFEIRNKEFYDKGGKIIKFIYELEKGSIIYIKDKVDELMDEDDFID